MEELSCFRQNKDFSLKKNPGSDDFLTESEAKIKSIEQLTKIKRKCNEFLDSGEHIMNSVIVSYLLKAIKIISK